MSDICKCPGTGCPKAKICHRTVAPSGFRQTFFLDPPMDKNTLECDYFWPATIRTEPHDNSIQNTRQ